MKCGCGATVATGSCTNPAHVAIPVGREWGEAFWTARDVLADEMRAASERAMRLMPALARFGAKPAST